MNGAPAAIGTFGAEIDGLILDYSLCRRYSYLNLLLRSATLAILPLCCFAPARRSSLFAASRRNRCSGL